MPFKDDVETVMSENEGFYYLNDETDVFMIDWKDEEE